MDLSKAYDRVSIPGLIYKLSRVGFSQAALKWFSSFLTDRQQRVRVHGSESSWETVKSGIPQGTVLGPTLFLLYINDLPQSLLNECALFADDTTAYGLGKLSKTICSSLSSDIDSAADWAKTWGMLFNAEKSEHLSIKQSSFSPSSSDSHVIMGGIQIPKVTEHKHLGIAIQSSLKWSRHICNVYTARAQRVGILRRLKRKLQPSTPFNNLKDLHWNCPSNHGICLCHLEWWPNSKAEKAAALILPESRCKSTSIANKVRLLFNVILQNQNASITTKSTKHVPKPIVPLRLSIS